MDTPTVLGAERWRVYNAATGEHYIRWDSFLQLPVLRSYMEELLNLVGSPFIPRKDYKKYNTIHTIMLVRDAIIDEARQANIDISTPAARVAAKAHFIEVGLDKGNYKSFEIKPGQVQQQPRPQQPARPAQAAAAAVGAPPARAAQAAANVPVAVEETEEEKRIINPRISSEVILNAAEEDNNGEMIYRSRLNQEQLNHLRDVFIDIFVDRLGEFTRNEIKATGESILP